jgi:beta-fructofuranosidase
LLYRSIDLRHWTYLHTLVEGHGKSETGGKMLDEGDMWECPDFFPLGSKHVLLISAHGKVHWKVGTYREQRFFPEKEGLVDWGAYYAAKSMLDRDGNRILWGWIPETRPEAEHAAAGWAGVMSLPRVCTLNEAGEFQMEVVPVVQTLRDKLRQHRAPLAQQVREPALENLRIHDLGAELILEYKPKGDGKFSLGLKSEDGSSFALITCSSESGKWVLQVNDLKAPIRADSTSPLKLRAFLDGSVLEVFANGITVITARIYQVPVGPLRVVLEGDTESADLKVWQMQPISKDRLTRSLCD